MLDEDTGDFQAIIPRAVPGSAHDDIPGTTFIAYVWSACSFRDAPWVEGRRVNVLRLLICLGPLRSRSTLS